MTEMVASAVDPLVVPPSYPAPMAPPHLLAAFDKFRGSATAADLDEAAAAAAAVAGWTATCLPMADGGEGLLDAVRGDLRTATVAGPLGDPVEAPFRIGTAAGVDGPVAVVEMAAASGLVLAGGAEGNDPEAATTRGTGELVLAAARAGARQVVVGCGGSATTDGGLGAVEVLAGRPELVGVELVVACDVTTPFVDAARVFGPQKGAGPDAVGRLTDRLERLAAHYLERFGLDVRPIPGAGAAGGLAGGLTALGGRLVSGFDLVADLSGLDAALDVATLVVTGEGRLDATSLAGKVVGGLLGRVGGRRPVLVVVGDRAGDLAPGALGEAVELVSLTERFGAAASLARPAALVGEVVAGALARDPGRGGRRR